MHVYSNLADLKFKPSKLLFDDELADKYKPVLACYESSNNCFVALTTEDKEHDQDVQHKIAQLGTKAERNYRLNRHKTYLVKPSVLVEIRNKVSDGKVHSHEKLRIDFDRLLATAISKNASDIHIKVNPLRAFSMFRIYGELQHYQDYDVSYMQALVGAMYNDMGEESSKDSEFNPKKIQETVIERFIDHKKYRIRFVSVPTVSSDSGLNKSLSSPFKSVSRILQIDRASMKDFVTLGFRSDLIEKIERAVLAPHGLGIVSGSVNNGKSTTLAAMTDFIVDNYPHKHIMTIESPVEYFISADTVTQHPVHTSVDIENEALEKSYKTSQSASLRSDIDVELQNEIRNEETARFAQLIVQSGHLFLSTVHAQSALNIVNRLVALGIERDVLCSPDFLRVLIHQSLLQTVCPSCALGYEEFSDVLAIEASDIVKTTHKHHALLKRIDTLFSLYGIDNKYKSQLRFRNYQGCEHCKHGVYGIKGLTVAAEVVKPTGKLIDLLAKNDAIGAYLHWRSSGDLTVKEDGILKVLKGEVCPTSFETKLGMIDEVEMHDLIEDALGTDFIKRVLNPYLEKQEPTNA
ncbi:GspE/PulE family protein [Cysteiniphilum marinum]|uniref:GspE/PulE family protein n=1 Tax=Cysteiniphilum marinum TaxID=2774191 RepID=UPI00193A5BFE|nr:ATPase, T2SS/T4P/T4SS family [Cysteiniphilum marinum]